MKWSLSISEIMCPRILYTAELLEPKQNVFKILNIVSTERCFRDCNSTWIIRLLLMARFTMRTGAASGAQVGGFRQMLNFTYKLWPLCELLFPSSWPYLHPWLCLVVSSCLNWKTLYIYILTVDTILLFYDLYLKNNLDIQSLDLIGRSNDYNLILGLH